MSNDLGNIIASFPARVSFVLLNDSDKEKFDKYGGWKGIGTVEFIPFLGNSEQTPEESAVARPLNINTAKYPLINEIVLITKLISYNAQSELGSFDSVYYYTDILGTFNSVEHNATPKMGSDVSNVTGLFKERGVLKLKKSPGDILLEGRSKNNIKLGSSIDNFDSVFKSQGKNPLLVITNNRDSSYDNKEYKFEDINKDGSSLYFLKGHDVSLLVSNNNFESFNKGPKLKETTKVVASEESIEKQDIEITSERPVETEVDFSRETCKKPYIDRNLNKGWEGKRQPYQRTIINPAVEGPKLTEKYGRVLAQSIMAVIKIEQNFRGFNYNFGGYDITAGGWSFNENLHNGYVVIPEGGTRLCKAFVSFKSYEAFIEQKVDDFKKRGFDKTDTAASFAITWYVKWNGYGARTAYPNRPTAEVDAEALRIAESAWNSVKKYV
jgi:hypothetical protein